MFLFIEVSAPVERHFKGDGFSQGGSCPRGFPVGKDFELCAVESCVFCADSFEYVPVVSVENCQIGGYAGTVECGGVFPCVLVFGGDGE